MRHRDMLAHTVSEWHPPGLTGDGKTRGRLDGDILINFHKRDSIETFLLAAQTVEGAVETSRALRAAGYIVSVRVWNGKAYAEERL